MNDFGIDIGRIGVDALAIAFDVLCRGKRDQNAKGVQQYGRIR